MFKLFKKRKQARQLEEEKMGLVFTILIAIARIMNIPPENIKDKMRDAKGMEEYARKVVNDR